MKIRLKICGMREPANIIQVAELLPAYIGFIFYPHSKRWVGEDFVISPHLPTAIKKVGVFVNENVEEMLIQVGKHGLDYVQLHGNESPADCAEIKTAGTGIIKAFPVNEAFDFRKTKAYQPHADFFLFDTASESYGGTGKTFDWNLLKAYDQQTPFFLSGGISAQHIAGVKKLEGMNIHAIDINSGAEILPGLKDVNKLKTISDILGS